MYGTAQTPPAPPCKVALMPRRLARADVFAFTSPYERRRADAFWAYLFGEPGAAASETAEGDDLRSWPGLTTLPDSIVDRIAANRDQVPIRASEFRPYAAGYSYPGKTIPPSEICTAQEKADGRLKEILERLDEDLKGEGGTSAVQTGDSVRFTWGRGFAHRAFLELWVKEFLTSTPAARAMLLDLGITLDGTTWKIVDTASKVVAVGEQAIELLSPKKPDDTTKRLLTIFMNVSEKFGTEAANAQWKITKEKVFYNKMLGPPKEVIEDPAWSKEAICYVIHCAMWGTFAGWERFKATGGDSKKILRLEVDCTEYYEKRGEFILVPPTYGKGRNQVSPSATMLKNMGAGYMIETGIVERLSLLEGAGPGDVVFEMSRAASPGQPFYILRGVPVMYDRFAEMMKEIRSVQAYRMSALLRYFRDVRAKHKNIACGRLRGYTRLKALRDWYASSENPRKHAFGLRPRVAMDAVLHRGEGQPSGWILNDARSANLPADQVELIKKEVGL